MDNTTSNGCGLLLIMFLAISAFTGFLMLFSVQSESVAVEMFPTIAIIEDTPATITVTQVFAATSTALPPTEAATAIMVATVAPTGAAPLNSTHFMINVLGIGDLNAEAVELVNTGDTIDLAGWQIADSDGNTFTFPNYTLFGGGVVRVMTRSGDDSPIALFWGQDAAIWSVGDTLTLRDPIGTTRAAVIVGSDS